VSARLARRPGAFAQFRFLAIYELAPFHGVITTVRLENLFWDVLHEIAPREHGDQPGRR
jgi:hypothetical protein